MAALDFPASPTTGDTYDVYTFDGEKWIIGDLPTVGAAAPDWVPPGAVFYFDFKTDPARGWDGATSTVLDAASMATLLGSDMMNTYYGEGFYVPEVIVPDFGYDYRSNTALSGNQGPAAIGAFKAMIPNGMTVVFTGAIKSLYTEPWIAFSNASGDYVEWWCYSSSHELEAWSTNDVIYLMSNVFDQLADTFMPNRVAFTHTATRLESAVNGSVAMGVVLDPAVDTPNGPLNMLVFDAAPIETIAVYSALPDMTGLSELSFLEGAVNPATAAQKQDPQDRDKHRAERRKRTQTKGEK
jgi:hypothetical protein